MRVSYDERRRFGKRIRYGHPEVLEGSGFEIEGLTVPPQILQSPLGSIRMTFLANSTVITKS